MVQSDLRRPERWRGRVQSPSAGWSVFVGAALAVLLGVLFWGSVWIVLRPSTSMNGDAPSELVDQAEAPVDDAEDVDAATVEGAVEDPEALAEDPAGPSEDAGALAESPDATAESEVAAIPPDQAEAEAILASTATQSANVEGPLYGPYEVADSAEASGRPVANVSTDGASGQPTARIDGLTVRAEEIAARAEEVTARSEEVTARTEELTARAEEFATKLEGLTAKIEELEAKLGVTGAGEGARPVAVPSPGPTTRNGQTPASGQAPASGRAPWVVQPLPAPGTRVAAGAITVEALARGEAPIARIHLVLDGVAQAVTLERRDEKTWRGRASARVNPGTHAVAISVVDSEGRVGSFKWQFEATAR